MSLDFKKKVQASFWVKSYSSVDNEIASCLRVTQVVSIGIYILCLKRSEAGTIATSAARRNNISKSHFVKVK